MYIYGIFNELTLFSFSFQENKEFVDMWINLQGGGSIDTPSTWVKKDHVTSSSSNTSVVTPSPSLSHAAEKLKLTNLPPPQTATLHGSKTL